METEKPTGKTKAVLRLVCEWDSCHLEFIDLDQYLAHVKIHCANSESFDNSNECRWDGCGFVANWAEELTRHTFFHAHHTKVKKIGFNLLQEHKQSNCTLSDQGRNLIPDLPENFVCYWNGCKNEFDNVEYFYRHVLHHTDCCEKGKNPKGGVTCLWEGCGGQFQNQHKLCEHLRTHSQEKVVACPNCGAFFANRTKFFDHVNRQVPLEMQDYQCSHCSKRFSSERLLRDHMRNHVNHYKCSLCDMTCPSPSSLNNHYRYRHNDTKPFTCPYCDYCSKTKADLRRHLNTHSSEAPYKCEQVECNYSTRSYQSLTLHRRKIHEGDSVPRYMCHICEKLFSRGNYLTKHLIKKHKFCWPSGHPRFRYKCDNDGFFRLQTVRYESIELTQPMMVTDSAEESDSPINTPSVKIEDQTESIVERLENEQLRLEEDPEDELVNSPPSTHELSEVERQHAQFRGSMVTKVGDMPLGELMNMVIHVVDTRLNDCLEKVVMSAMERCMARMMTAMLDARLGSATSHTASSGDRLASPRMVEVSECLPGQKESAENSFPDQEVHDTLEKLNGALAKERRMRQEADHQLLMEQTGAKSAAEQHEHFRAQVQARDIATQRGSLVQQVAQLSGMPNERLQSSHPSDSSRNGIGTSFVNCIEDANHLTARSGVLVQSNNTEVRFNVVRDRQPCLTESGILRVNPGAIPQTYSEPAGNQSGGDRSPMILHNASSQHYSWGINHSLKFRHKDIKAFTGNPADCLTFLADMRQVKYSTGASDQQMLDQCIPSALDVAVRGWYTDNKAYFRTMDEFEQVFKQIYGPTAIQQRLLATSPAQKPGESFVIQTMGPPSFHPSQ